MNEHPIIFGPMVQAILDGQKTQTRRVMQPQPQVLDQARRVYGAAVWQWGKRQFWPPEILSLEHGTPHPRAWGGPEMLALCPYGQPGDRLWVRETFYLDHYDWIERIPKERPAAVEDHLYYRADGECCEQIPECCCDGKPVGWRPPIHMPRWASRLTLEIAEVRAQRLQEITEEDAQAEGCAAQTTTDGRGTWVNVTAREVFQGRWDYLNGKRAPWTSNPWVWAITFRRIP